MNLNITNFDEMINQLGDSKFQGQYSLVEGCSQIIRVKFGYYESQVVELEFVDSFPRNGHK